MLQAWAPPIYRPSLDLLGLTQERDLGEGSCRMMRKSPGQKEAQRTLGIPKTLPDEKRQSVCLGLDNRGHVHVSFKGFSKIQFELSSGRVPVDF